METLFDICFTDNNKDKVVISTFNKDYTVREVEKLSSSFLDLLGRNSDLTGKRVALLVPNTYAYISLVFAINKLGGTVVPLSPLFREGDLNSILTSANPHVIFTVSKHNEVSFKELITNWIRESQMACELYDSEDGIKWTSSIFDGKEAPKDTFERHFILFTSGSTGMPKGLAVGQNAVVTGTQLVRQLLHAKSEDTFLSIPPQTVAFGILSILCAIRYRHTVVIPDAFDIPQIVTAMKRTSVTKVLSTPSILKAIYNLGNHLYPEVFKNIEECYLAGEMVTNDDIEPFKLMNHSRFTSIYGLSEAGAILTLNLRGQNDWQIESGVDIQIVDGELVAKTGMLFSHYYNQPELTNEVFLADGWFRTGDIATITEENKVILLGRKKDIIKKGGQQVIPGEVEKVLTSHSQVQEAAVFGSKHPVYGEEVVAFVVLKGEIDVVELYQHCVREIARYKVPDHIEVIDSMPVISGKIDKTTLRNQYKEIRKVKEEI